VGVNWLEELGEQYGAWWIDVLGEHNHVGGLEATRWLLERAGVAPGEMVLDAGAFVGGTARMIAASTGARVVATDANADFLRAGAAMEGGEAAEWVTAATQRLPFGDAAFDGAWALDAALAPRELSRVTRPGAHLCLCCEVPADSRGGMESFLEEWVEHGWSLAAHRNMSLEATQTWRRAEAELVGRRPHYERRYGARAYLSQLDLLAGMVRAYERGELGHGLFVFKRAD
jgi:SAM-dependent methyltransferase